MPPFYRNGRATTAPAIDDDLLALDKEINGGESDLDVTNDGKMLPLEAFYLSFRPQGFEAHRSGLQTARPQVTTPPAAFLCNKF